MGDDPKVPEDIPVHVVKNSIAFYNKANGFYANHHLGGIKWYNNSAYRNAANFCMVNRKSAAEATDIDGIGHILRSNLSYEPRTADAHIIQINYPLCRLDNNSFYPTAIEFNNNSFNSLDGAQLMRPRKEDGSLPDITFLTPKTNSNADKNKIGWTFIDENIEADEENTAWISLAGIVVEGNFARIEGPDAALFNRFWINDTSVSMSNQTVDLSKYTGTLQLMATSSKGGIIKLTIIKE